MKKRVGEKKGLLAVGSEEDRDLLAVSFGGDLLAVCEGLFSVSVEREMTPTSGLEISENRHLPCITKCIGIHGENLIFSRNIKIFTCPAA